MSYQFHCDRCKAEQEKPWLTVVHSPGSRVALNSGWTDGPNSERIEPKYTELCASCANSFVAWLENIR